MSAALPRQRWLDPIDAFVREHGRSTPRWAVVCTYECDPALLERTVLPALTRRGRGFRALVLADAGALQKQLSEDHPLCARFNLHPVRLTKGGRGIFHPKLVFLRAGRAARVCCGSANVSTGGFGGNLELWTHTDDLEVVGAVARFLVELTSCSSVLVDPACKRGITRAVSGIDRKSSERVWTSLGESFVERARRLPGIQSAALDVISPAYATPKGFSEVRKAFPCASITLHTDDNVAIPDTKTLVYHPAMAGDDDEVGADQSDPPRLHAKLFVFRNSKQTRAWLGSANFTAQALTKTAANGGNVEILFETALPSGQAACLSDDLGTLFKPSKEPPNLRSEDDDDAPSAAGSVISCELVHRGGGPQLVVHTTPDAASVKLGASAGAVAVTVRIQRSRGVVQGADVPRLLPGCEDTGPGVWVIYEQVGRDRVPVVVNAPHVPDHDTSRPNQAPLDTLLDELRGVLPKPRALPDETDDTEGDTPDDTDDSDAEFEQEEKRLAEAHHQGVLDQLAVKTAVAKKLIDRLTSGDERAEFLRRLERDCKVGCAPHLHSVVTEWFRTMSSEQHR
jgi:hypothetical protein